MELFWDCGGIYILIILLAILSAILLKGVEPLALFLSFGLTVGFISSYWDWLTRFWRKNESEYRN